MAYDPNEDGMAGAGITPGQRLGRIEDVLQRIDTKLDNKADKADVVNLEKRVRDIEMHGTDGIRTAIEDLKVARTEQTKEAALQMAEVTKNVSALQRKLAYYAGAIAAMVFVVNLVLFLVSKHLP